MPAAAVIPAPSVYIKVVAVEKLVVGLLLRRTEPALGCASGTVEGNVLNMVAALSCMVPCPSLLP